MQSISYATYRKLKERFRRKGVAGLLLGTVLESAAHHVEQVEIVVADITEDVITLLERFGFRFVA